MQISLLLTSTVRLTMMLMNTYKTVKAFASDELVEKRSRFIGYCKPVSTQDEAIAFINEIKTKHWDARHNVYAYVIKDEGSRCSTRSASAISPTASLL